MSTEVHTRREQLRYLDAEAVECPAGRLDSLSVLAEGDESVGVVDGVLIDPATRKLRYYVIGRERPFLRRRYLVSADMPAVVVSKDRTLRVDVPADEIRRERFDSRSVRPFSDDDLVTAIFSNTAA